MPAPSVGGLESLDETFSGVVAMTIAQAGVVMYGGTALLLRARVEGRKKGVQSVRLTERCGRNSRVAQQRGGSRGRCGGTARNTKTKAKDMSRGLVGPSMQSNRQQQHPITVPKISMKKCLTPVSFF